MLLFGVARVPYPNLGSLLLPHIIVFGRVF